MIQLKMTMIYTNSENREVVLDVPFTPENNSVMVEVYKNDTLVYSKDPVSPTDSVYKFNLPYSLTTEDSDYEVRWSLTYSEDGELFEYVKSDLVSVVTPILPLKEIEAIVEGGTEKDIHDIERAVRYIIQAHTGQFFGKYTGPKTMVGSGHSHLALPSRLIRLLDVNDSNYWRSQIAVTGGGFFIQFKTFSGPPSIRADYHGWHANPWDWSNYAPIVAPYTKAITRFNRNTQYKINGVWGWETVPPEVKEAARLLINDYACGDSAYRDRFLTSMTAADWRIQFHEGAFSSTGNVRANQLLAKFIMNRGWAVI